MKKHLLILFVIIFSVNCYSQISYEKGYFINNGGQKTECYIKNIDWLDNPTQIQYKNEMASDAKTLSVNAIQEFGIYNVSRYLIASVEIDRSSNNISDLSKVKEPNYTNEKLLLKALIVGRASLYEYQENGLVRFFYNLKDSNIEQLVFKRYKVNDLKIGRNELYKQQLWNSLQCGDIELDMVRKVDYDAKDLSNFFINFNKCKNSDFVDYNNSKSKGAFNLNIRPGVFIGYSHIETLGRDYHKKSEIGYRFGIEAEAILPFNKNKWAIIIEPTYHHFEFSSVAYDQTIDFKYTSIELPIGIRHYFFLNDNLRIFLNASYAFEIDLDTSIKFGVSSDLELKGSSHGALGFGINLKNKYMVEVRLGTKRQLSPDLGFFTDYSNTSLILGYNIF